MQHPYQLTGPYVGHLDQAKHQSTIARGGLVHPRGRRVDSPALGVVCQGWALMHPTPSGTINSLRGAMRSSECLESAGLRYEIRSQKGKGHRSALSSLPKLSPLPTEARVEHGW